MPRRRLPVTTVRKEPRQARSTQLVRDLLHAAARVLVKDGARRFTTARVAERAGVSVGSLYQYFPNKEAILFRLQADEWRETGGALAQILGDVALPPPQRLRRAVHAFFRSECDEAALRNALADAAPLYRALPEVQDHRSRALAVVRRFLDEALPRVPAPRRAFATKLLAASLASLGKHVSEDPDARAAVETWAEGTAEMYGAWLAALGARPRVARRKLPR